MAVVFFFTNLNKHVIEKLSYETPIVITNQVTNDVQEKLLVAKRSPIFGMTVERQNMYKSPEEYLTKSGNLLLEILSQRPFRKTTKSVLESLKEFLGSLKTTFTVEEFSLFTPVTDLLNHLVNLIRSVFIRPEHSGIRKRVYQIVALSLFEDETDDYANNINRIVSSMLESNLSPERLARHPEVRPG